MRMHLDEKTKAQIGVAKRVLEEIKGLYSRDEAQAADPATHVVVSATLGSVLYSGMATTAPVPFDSYGLFPTDRAIRGLSKIKGWSFVEKQTSGNVIVVLFRAAADAMNAVRGKKGLRFDSNLVAILDRHNLIEKLDPKYTNTQQDTYQLTRDGQAVIRHLHRLRFEEPKRRKGFSVITGGQPIGPSFS